MHNQTTLLDKILDNAFALLSMLTLGIGITISVYLGFSGLWLSMIYTIIGVPAAWTVSTIFLIPAVLRDEPLTPLAAISCGGVLLAIFALMCAFIR